MVEVKIHPIGKDHGQYLFVVIAAKYNEKWVWVKHRDRNTWEIPGGHIEKGETADNASRRELIEETGAVRFSIVTVCDYWVRIGEKEGLSRLYFANIQELGPLPASEISGIGFFDAPPTNQTYPDIQPLLFNEVLLRLAQQADGSNLKELSSQ